MADWNWDKFGDDDDDDDETEEGGGYQKVRLAHFASHELPS